jgi:hypothetical protein
MRRRKRLTVSYRRDPGTPYPIPAWKWNSRRREQVMPLIRISGKWLDRIGFPIGSKLALEAEPGRLVLTAMPLAGPLEPGDLACEVCEPAPEE